MLDGGAAYSWHSIHTRRTLDLGTIGGLQTAQYDARTLQGFGEASDGFTIGSVTFAPFASYTHVRTHHDGFGEVGSVAALSVISAIRDLDVVQAGGRLSGIAPIGGAVLLPHLAVSYQRLWGNTLGIENATLAGAGSAFTVVGAQTGKDAVRVEGGADLQTSSRFRIGAGAFGQTSGAIGEYGVRATASFFF